MRLWSSGDLCAWTLSPLVLVLLVGWVSWPLQVVSALVSHHAGAVSPLLPLRGWASSSHSVSCVENLFGVGLAGGAVARVPALSGVSSSCSLPGVG